MKFCHQFCFGISFSALFTVPLFTGSFPNVVTVHIEFVAPKQIHFKSICRLIIQTLRFKCFIFSSKRPKHLHKDSVYYREQ